VRPIQCVEWMNVVYQALPKKLCVWGKICKRTI